MKEKEEEGEKKGEIREKKIQGNMAGLEIRNVCRARSKDLFLFHFPLAKVTRYSTLPTLVPRYSVVLAIVQYFPG